MLSLAMQTQDWVSDKRVHLAAVGFVAEHFRGLHTEHQLSIKGRDSVTVFRSNTLLSAYIQLESISANLDDNLCERLYLNVA